MVSTIQLVSVDVLVLPIHVVSCVDGEVFSAV